jgi:hypothetical protein
MNIADATLIVLREARRRAASEDTVDPLTAPLDQLRRGR